MHPRAHYLAILGLPPEATAQEIAMAYKDLIRVWHPDRFQHDKRLQLRAENETKKINDAMERIRKLPKEPPAKKRPPVPYPPIRPKSTQQTPPTGGDSFSRVRGPASYTPPLFELAPLIIHQRLLASFGRLLIGLVTLYISNYLIESGQETPLQGVCGIILGFSATNMSLWNLTLLCCRRPSIRVDNVGLFILGFGKLFWPDVQRVWAERSVQTMYLAVNFTTSYIERQPLLLRAIYKLRSTVKRSHLLIRFHGLNSDPIQVVNAITLQHDTNNIIILRYPSAGQHLIFWCNFISLLCPIMLIVRYVTQETLGPEDYLPYIGIFLLCRVYVIAKCAIFLKTRHI